MGAYIIAKKDLAKLDRHFAACAAEHKTAKKAKKEQWDVLSPDGISISRTETYPSKAKAEEAFELWKERYERQGYYSCCDGRISLEYLKGACEFIRLK